MKIQVLWDVMPCRLVNSGWCYGGITQSEILATIYQLTWLNIPEDLNLHFISHFVIAWLQNFDWS
jgi:hypothetical protein